MVHSIEIYVVFAVIRAPLRLVFVAAAAGAGAGPAFQLNGAV